MSSPELLVLEDNVPMAQVLRFSLERAGYRVCVASSAEQALDSARLIAFDLILTDQQLPGMTGTEFLTRLRDIEHHRATPILMLTAKGLELDVPRLRLELGVRELFLKPFSPREVLAAIQNTLASPASA